jgi:hypothetical protein
MYEPPIHLRSIVDILIQMCVLTTGWSRKSVHPTLTTDFTHHHQRLNDGDVARIEDTRNGAAKGWNRLRD